MAHQNLICASLPKTPDYGKTDAGFQHQRRQGGSSIEVEMAVMSPTATSLSFVPLQDSETLLALSALEEYEKRKEQEREDYEMARRLQQEEMDEVELERYLQEAQTRRTARLSPNQVREQSNVDVVENFALGASAWIPRNANANAIPNTTVKSEGSSDIPKEIIFRSPAKERTLGKESVMALKSSPISFIPEAPTLSTHKTHGGSSFGYQNSPDSDKNLEEGIHKINHDDAIVIQQLENEIQKLRNENEKLLKANKEETKETSSDQNLNDSVSMGPTRDDSHKSDQEGRSVSNTTPIDNTGNSSVANGSCTTCTTVLLKKYSPERREEIRNFGTQMLLLAEQAEKRVVKNKHNQSNDNISGNKNDTFHKNCALHDLD